MARRKGSGGQEAALFNTTHWGRGEREGGTNHRHCCSHGDGGGHSSLSHMH